MGFEKGKDFENAIDLVKVFEYRKQGYFPRAMITRSSKKPNYFSLRHEALYLTGVDIQVALRSALNVE